MVTKAVFPIVIERDAYYTQEQVKSLTGLSIRSIGDACRTEQLRSTERAGKRFLRGSWLIEWFEGKPPAIDHSPQDTEPALA